MKAKSPMTRFFGLLILAAWWSFGLIVLAGLILHWRSGDHLSLARYTGYLMPWLLGALLPGALGAWLLHHRSLAVLLAVPAVLILAAQAPLFLPLPPTSAQAAAGLRVMSFNAWSRNHDAGSIARVVLDQKPDILLLQEIEETTFSRLIERLEPLYGSKSLHFAYAREMLQAVVSRFPVEPRGGMREKGQAQKTLIRTPGEALTVINVHPSRCGRWSKRYSQLASLLEEEVAPAGGPVILGGDFNTPDGSQTYRLIGGYLQNAHRQAGFSFGFTYPSSSVRLWGLLPLPPVVRIDHIFYSEHLVALKAGTVRDSGGSDHYPVVADLVRR